MPDRTSAENAQDVDMPSNEETERIELFREIRGILKTYGLTTITGKAERNCANAVIDLMSARERKLLEGVLAEANNDQRATKYHTWYCTDARNSEQNGCICPDRWINDTNTVWRSIIEQKIKEG
jgi:hypothetical protein